VDIRQTPLNGVLLPGVCTGAALRQLAWRENTLRAETGLWWLSEE
jgi:hypothetical protein